MVHDILLRSSNFRKKANFQFNLYGQCASCGVHAIREGTRHASRCTRIRTSMLNWSVLIVLLHIEPFSNNITPIPNAATRGTDPQHLIITRKLKYPVELPASLSTHSSKLNYELFLGKSQMFIHYNRVISEPAAQICKIGKGKHFSIDVNAENIHEKAFCLW